MSDASQPHPVVAGLTDAEALDYNPLDGRIYWADSAAKRISRVFANGSGVEAVVTFDLTRPAGIAVDPLGGNIFFSDKGQKRITMATQTGQYRRILLWKNLTSPEALQLDLLSGVLFWLDTGPPARVEKARVDGTERSTVVSLTDPGTYHGLAIDTARHRLYWTKTTAGKTGGRDAWPVVLTYVPVWCCREGSHRVLLLRWVWPSGAGGDRPGQLHPLCSDCVAGYLNLVPAELSRG